ncbi:unnamed protein product [Calypogeia fissa]
MEMEIDSLPLPFTSGQTDFRFERIRLDEDIAKEDEWRWAVAQAFFDHRGLVADHIDSYNRFVEKGIHEMFREAEPFEVEPDGEASIQKKAVVSFGGVELSTKPEVETEDRAMQPRKAPEDSDGKKYGDYGAGKGKGLSMNWLTNADEAGPSSRENRDIASGGAGSSEGHQKGKSNGDHVTNESDEDDDDPPKISQETCGIDDPRKNEAMKEDLEQNGDCKSGESDDADVDDFTQGKTGPVAPKFPQFSKPRTGKPNLRLLPVEARVRGLTYSSPIYVKVIVKTTTQVSEPPPTKKSKSSSSSSSSRRKSVTDTRESRVLLGRIPVMVKSSLCHLSDSHSSPEPLKGDCSLDSGGYFIIKGSEKVIVAQEERNLQRLWVSCMNGVWTASCTSRRKGFSQYNYHKTTVKLTVPKKTGSTGPGGALPLITVSLTGVEALPIGVLYCALGVSTDREILEMICGDLSDTELLQVVSPSLLECDRALAGAQKEFDSNTFVEGVSKRDREVAKFHIGSKTFGKKASDDKAADTVLQARFLPHIGCSYRSKALYLGYMIRTVALCFLGRQTGTDRDDMKNKRLEFAGEIISHQFRKLMGQVVNTMKKKMQKHLSKGVEIQNAEKYLDEKVITKGLKVAFTSGNWKGHDTVKNSGIVFDLKRGNPLSTLCQLRELRHFVPPTTRVGDEARHPTFSQWGKVCPIDTPDGESCGLVKNMAITGMVSCGTPEEPVLKLLADSTIQELDTVDDLSSLYKSIKIFLNGRWVGIVADAREAARLANKVRKARRRGPSKIDLTQVEVVQDNNRQELHISTDGGRILRPLLVVKDQTLVLNEDKVVAFQYNVDKSKRFQWLLSNGVVELLGIEEEEKAMVALHGEHIWNEKEKEQRGQRSVQFTHAELHPSLILGLSASVIPFPNRNQSSRNLFQAHKHSKQAIGFYVTNINSRADTSGQHLFYPQVQLVKTNTYDCLQKPEMFSGQNAIVAIACYTGYNQEDSIIMDQSSLDRGMFRTTHYRTIKTDEKKEIETFGKPSELDIGGEKLARSLEKLDEDGLPVVGLGLGVGDVIVGKVCKSQSNLDSSARLIGDRSQRLKAHEKGRVSQVVLVQDEDGQKVAKVKLRESRMPLVGDKFSSMHGQKGVVGMVFTQEDLPFTNEGIVPDVLINPHAFPSRQTLGQMCESALGKVVASTGQRLFATPFNPSCTVESIQNSLHKAGYERWGNEMMYNGFTGLPMAATIFIGSTFYQRLTHMVEDKIKYRSRGHVHPLTRQPVSDRKRHGGVKFGEMERDCLIAHGAAATLQERSFILSDFHTVHVCTVCEQLANWNADRVPACRHCTEEKKKGSSIVKLELPYACKLLIQELMSMGISVRLKTERM